jgi:hypothetical protein
MAIKPEKLYHGSSRRIEGPLEPVLLHGTSDHIHERPAVFATERADVAGLFMFQAETLASVGFEQNIAYICIWGTAEEFAPKDKLGFLYVLPSATFEKIGKEYEWQSFDPVAPLEIKEFHKTIEGMIELEIQVYFINDDAVFDKIVADKDNRAPILKELLSENQKQDLNVKLF